MSGIVGQNLGRASGLIKSGGVGADSVTSASIADDAIDSEHYTNASIDNAHLADDAVGTDEIADNAVTLAKMAGGTDGNIISFDASGDPVAISTGSDGQVLTSTGAGSPPAFEAAAGGTTNYRPNVKPLLINGDMQVAQRSTSETGQTGSGYIIMDRMRTRFDGTHRWTLTQEALTADEAFEDGFSKAYKFDCTTATASLSASDKFWFHYKFEGQDIQLFKKGTASAEKTTIAFWVKATKTGTNIVELYDESSTNRFCSVAYTISSSNTWEKKVVVIPADTAGTVVDNTNGETINLFFIFAAGSNYTDGGTLQVTWVDYGSGTTRNLQHVGQVNHADSTSNNVHITGIQVEVGEYTSSTIPPFQHESYGDNLARCYRYYKHIGSAGDAYFNSGFYYNSTSLKTIFRFGIPFRAAPSIDQDGGTNYFSIYRDGAADTFDDFSMDGGTTARFASVYNNTDVSGTAGMAGGIYFGTSSRLAFDAEL